MCSSIPPEHKKGLPIIGLERLPLIGRKIALDYVLRIRTILIYPAIAGMLESVSKLQQHFPTFVPPYSVN